MSFEKTAQEHYNFLLEKYEKSQGNEEVEKLAMIVVTKMVEREDITEPGEVIEKLAELRQQTTEDLKVLEKAVELGRKPGDEEPSKTASASLGSLTDEPNGDGQDRLTKFLLEDYY
jgi:outer membrane PBP1 activator LpoA protein